MGLFLYYFHCFQPRLLVLLEEVNPYKKREECYSEIFPFQAPYVSSS